MLPFGKSSVDLGRPQWGGKPPVRFRVALRESGRCWSGKVGAACGLAGSGIGQAMSQKLEFLANSPKDIANVGTVRTLTLFQHCGYGDP